MSIILGLLISIGLILGSVMIDGDSPAELLGLSAAMIVLGGTFGAVVTQFGLGRATIAFKAVLTLLKPPKTDISAFIAEIADWSNRARSQGSLALETVLGNAKDPFQRKGLQMIIDNTPQEDLHAILKILSDNDFRNDMMSSEFFEAAGGYSPTIGVLGAVLGLIHVMTHLDHPSELGSGIATAFIATVYGVGCANMMFLPLGNRLGAFADARKRERQIVIQGFMLLAEGKSGTLIRQNLQSFLPEPAIRKSSKDAPADDKGGVTVGQAA
jgi:chemotaxis protein MotA